MFPMFLCLSSAGIPTPSPARGESRPRFALIASGAAEFASARVSHTPKNLRQRGLYFESFQ